MKSFINWLTVALLFVCLNATFAQDPFLLSTTSAQLAKKTTAPTPTATPSVETPVSYQKAQKAISRVKTQHMVSSEIQSDTNGMTPKPDFIDKINTAAVQGWEAAFKSGKRTYKDSLAFHIEVDMIHRKRVEDSLAEELNRRAAEFPLQKTNYAAPVPAPTFQKSEITVKFENGQIVPISQLSATQKKAIIDTITAPKPLTVAQILKNIDPDDEIDSLIGLSHNFTFRGEIQEKVLRNEVATPAYQEARIKRKAIPKIKVTDVKEDVRTRQQFIAKYEVEMRKAELDGIPYAIKMGQAILEGSTHDKGLSQLAIKQHNTYGIKCNGGTCKVAGCPHGVYKDDREDDTFKYFTSISECIKYHTQFLQKNDRYNACFECGVSDVACWAWRLQQSGYATHKHYYELILSTVNAYDLTDEPITETRAQVKKRLAKRL